MINVLTEDACIRSEAEVFNTNGEPSSEYSGFIPEEYRGLERYEARKAIVAKFEELGLLEKIEDHVLSSLMETAEVCLLNRCLPISGM